LACSIVSIAGSLLSIATRQVSGPKWKMLRLATCCR
jgi:hypothetical protein